jgi:NTE family protein
MSGPTGLPADLYGASRWHASNVARREVRALRESGAAVVVFRPGPAEQQMMGNDLTARDRIDQIGQQAFLGAAPTPPGRRSGRC